MKYIGSKIELYSNGKNEKPHRVFHVKGDITKDSWAEPYVSVFTDDGRLFATFTGDDSGSGWVMGYAFADLIHQYHPSVRENFGEMFSAIIHNVCDPEMEADSVYTVRNLSLG